VERAEDAPGDLNLEREVEVAAVRWGRASEGGNPRRRRD